MELSEKATEILLIAQEECSEVSQVISKIFRFGLHNHWYGKINKNRLEEEIGDLLCMVELLINEGILDSNNVSAATIEKREKLKLWSKIYNS